MSSTKVLHSVRRGVIAGAVGVSALNVATYLDMLLRGRPPSRMPEDAVEVMMQRAGLKVPGDHRQSDARRSALGSLGGLAVGSTVGVIASLAQGEGPRGPWPMEALATGTLAMAITDVPATALGLTNPRSWRRTDWLADVIPHLAYGAATASTLDALAAAPEQHPTSTHRSTGGLLRCAALGAAAGCRSSLGLLGARLANGRSAGPMWAVVASEVALDKLPMAPSRTVPPSLVSRIASAAAGSQRLAHSADLAYLPAVTAGIAGSLAGAFGGVAWRQWATGRMPGWTAAGIEDVAAITVATLVARR